MYVFKNVKMGFDELFQIQQVLEMINKMAECLNVCTSLSQSMLGNVKK